MEVLRRKEGVKEVYGCMWAYCNPELEDAAWEADRSGHPEAVFAAVASPQPSVSYCVRSAGESDWR